MEDKIKNTLKRFPMLKKGSRLLLCVSGGPDSVAMLLAFSGLLKHTGLSLSVAHLNHRLRGEDSDRDEEYVKQLARRLRLRAVTAREDVRSLARKKKLSLEDAARRSRYSFFLKAARDLDIDTIATAHTRDDQAETVLMRILRGTGFKGLRGIPLKRKMAEITLIRPLIDISRQEVEDYLRRKRVVPRFDASNLKSEFFRNRIRRELIPLLKKKYSPRIKEQLSNLAELLDKDYEYLAMKQKVAFKKIARVKRGLQISFSLKAFKREHLSIQRALARTAIESLKGNLDGIDYRHWKEIESLANDRPNGSIVNLPSGIGVTKTKATFKFYNKNKKEKEREDFKPLAVNIPGTTRFGQRLLRAKVLNRYNHTRSHPKSVEYIDIGRVALPLYLRFRKAGDKMIPLGMSRAKKVSDILIDEKVPLNRRNRIPLVVSAKDDILWICNIRISDICKILPTTKKVLRLELLKR